LSNLGLNEREGIKMGVFNGKLAISRKR